MAIMLNNSLFFPNIRTPAATDDAFVWPRGLCLGIPPQMTTAALALSMLAPHRTASASVVSAAGVTPQQRQQAALEADRLGLPYYQWGPWKSGSQPGYMPMVYQDTAKEHYVADAHKVWLLLNEPNESGQADLTIRQSRLQVGAALALGVQRWIGPNVSVSYNDRGWGQAWMDRWIARGAPIPDQWGIHFYPGENNSLDGFDRMYEEFYELMAQFNVVRPIVVTETNAGEAGPHEQVAYMQGLVERMEKYQDFAAAFWFSAFYESNGNIYPSSLLDAARQRNYIGEAFREIVDGRRS